jgi:hypothetical protein
MSGWYNQPYLFPPGEEKKPMKQMLFCLMGITARMMASRGGNHGYKLKGSSQDSWT